MKSTPLALKAAEALFAAGWRIGEVADLLKVCTRTVERWHAKGKIKRVTKRMRDAELYRQSRRPTGKGPAA